MLSSPARVDFFWGRPVATRLRILQNHNETNYLLHDKSAQIRRFAHLQVPPARNRIEVDFRGLHRDNVPMESFFEA